MTATGRRLAILLVAGCASKGRFADLEASYDAAVADRDRARAEALQLRAELDEVEAQHGRRLEAFAQVYAALAEVQAAGLARLVIEDGRAALQLEADALFDPGSADLTPAGRQAVARVAEALAATSAEFQVEGHTDADPIDSREFPSSWHLGADRAIGVVTAMTEAGLPPERLSAATYGPTAPIASNEREDGEQRNRRIEIVWMPELSEALPYPLMLEELEARRASR